jgi:hypothetical protein
VSSQGSQQQTDQAAGKAALLSAIDSVYLHNIRYSLIGATAPGARLALEAGAQASEELLARGALLGCASAWLTNRCVAVVGRVAPGGGGRWQRRKALGRGRRTSK